MGKIVLNWLVMMWKAQIFLVCIGKVDILVVRTLASKARGTPTQCLWAYFPPVIPAVKNGYPTSLRVGKGKAARERWHHPHQKIAMRKVRCLTSHLTIPKRLKIGEDLYLSMLMCMAKKYFKNHYLHTVDMIKCLCAFNYECSWIFNLLEVIAS